MALFTALPPILHKFCLYRAIFALGTLLRGRGRRAAAGSLDLPGAGGQVCFAVVNGGELIWPGCQCFL